MARLLLTFIVVLLASCQTSDSVLSNTGHNATYIQGFHDGRHSGMQEEGNNWEHYVKDDSSFKGDDDYRQGWLDGEVEGKRIQRQATTVGNVAAGTYSGVRIKQEADKNTDFKKIGKDAVKGVDASTLKILEQD